MYNIKWQLRRKLSAKLSKKHKEVEVWELPGKND